MRFWSSDWHVDHDNIIDFANRPFRRHVVHQMAFGDVEMDVPDTEAMNQALIDNTNDLVGPGDELWLVGDVAMSNRKVSVPRFKELLCRNLFLVPGNHDKCHRMFKNFADWVPLYEDAGFTVLNSQEYVTIAGEEVLVCHFPYWGDSQFEDRYSGLRPDDVGQWLIHGHTHSDVAVRGRQIHVGVDAHSYMPVSEEWVADVIRQGSETL